jgi:hypothetical protein
MAAGICEQDLHQLVGVRIGMLIGHRNFAVDDQFPDNKGCDGKSGKKSAGK